MAARTVVDKVIPRAGLEGYLQSLGAQLTSAEKTRWVFSDGDGRIIIVTGAGQGKVRVQILSNSCAC